LIEEDRISIYGQNGSLLKTIEQASAHAIPSRLAA
jgi:hypothetical protein